MPRMVKAREVDQALYEALSFAMRDDEDLLASLEQLVEQDASDSLAAEEADRLAADAEARARQRVIAAEQTLHECREEQRIAHEHRLATKRVNASFRKREPIEVSVVKRLRVHMARNRAGVVEWAGFKGFSREIRPELQLFVRGGLKRLVDARKQHGAEGQDVEQLSQAEIEAI